jgi:preprotein translocase subunit SecE
VANAASSGVLAVNSRRSIPLAEKEKKTKKSENAIQRYFRETSGELRKVNWPTWPEAKRLTGLVLLVMLIMGIFLATMDYLAHGLMNLLLFGVWA